MQKVAYLTATITSVNDEDDTASFTGIGKCPSGSDIPIFYHCEYDSILRDNGALEGAAGAFSVGDKVIVQCKIISSTGYKPLYVIGFVDKPKQCISEWNEEWNSTFCGNHQWEERISYYNDWKGINGIYYCDTAPSIETTLNGEVIHHLHENLGPTHRDVDWHKISLASADGNIPGVTRVIFNFPIAQLIGTPKFPSDSRRIRFDVAYKDQYGVFGYKIYHLAYAGSGSPTIYSSGVEHDELLDEGNPVDVWPSGSQVNIYTETRRLVTAEWTCDYIRFR